LLDDILYTIRLDIKKNVATYYKMTEYVFYKLECIDGSCDDTYIGSCVNLFRRQSKCKYCVKDISQLDKKHSCMRLYGGFNNWRWITLETGLYALELHSFIREQQLIDLHQPTMNDRRAYATMEQKKQQNAVSKKANYDANKVNINIKRQLIYANADKNELHAKQKLYADANRDTINARRRAKAAAKRALLLQPVVEPVDELTSPHAV
jgi:hypothetical protein